MTGQASDIFLIEESVFDLTRASAGPLFNPHLYGFSPVATSTSCWRGFRCGYTIADEALLLQTLEISNGHRGPRGGLAKEIYELPEFNGVTPNENYCEYQAFQGIYENLSLPLHYTGSVLLGCDLPEDFARVAGGADPWDYAIVIQVRFDAGKVVDCEDVSPIFEVFRKRYVSFGLVDYDQRRNAKRYMQRHLDDGFPL
jgi:hypothetical protein